jgi:hypothetical protein
MHETWILLGLKAIKLGFDDNEQVDPNKSTEEIESAKKHFYKCLENEPTEAWPYIKLADLISEKEEKIRLYNESLKVEENDFVKARLYDLIVRNL